MRSRRILRTLTTLSTLSTLFGCSRAESAPPLFELLSPEATGVTFVNELPESREFNILNYLYYYNGGGVAAGAIDNDGLTDLYITSNLGLDHLYQQGQLPVRGHHRQGRRSRAEGGRAALSPWPM